MSTDLVLDVKSLGSVRGNPALVETMLRHVRTVAPGINVPFKTPHVVVGPLLQAAGLFSERDGWVTLTVSEGFFDHRDAACAILCHEIAHYVLNACGIRESERGANERLTDVAMFVFGLGDVFLAGYKAAPMAYRPGHKLGYLSEAEYDFVDKHVFELHLHGTAQSAQSDIQERRFKAVVPDAAARGRLIEAEKKKRPSASYAELVSGILDTYRPR